MRTRTKITGAIASIVLAAAAIAGCSSDTDTGSSTTKTAVEVSAGQNAAAVLAANKAVHSTDGDDTWDESSVVDIKLTGGSATVSGQGATVDGATVAITKGGTYRLTGTLNGQVVIDAPDATVKLILNGATVASSSTAAIAATAADKVVVILADGSQNTLSDTSSYADSADVNAALFSAADLTIAGKGALTVRGNGNDGIAGKDGLVVESGALTVTAADDGIRGKDYLVVTGGTVTVNAGGDGLKADNTEDGTAGYVSIAQGTVTVTATGDGIDATTDLVVTGGTLAITSGGGSSVRPADDTSAKGLKSGVITVLEGGTTTADSSDDAVHSDGAVHVNGAKLTVASGDDAVHADGSVVIDAGAVTITSSVEGLEAADIVVNGGSTSVVSSDDGVNATDTTSTQSNGRGGGGGEAVADASLVITGGTLVVNSGGDGLDSNGTATISGGTIVVNGPTNSGNGALDVNGTFAVSGGVLVAAGSAGMAVAPDTESPQGWLSATLDSAVPAGTTLHVVDSDGKVVATFVTSKTVQNLVVSSADITDGEEYKVYAGGTSSGSSTGGLAKSGDLGSATAIATVTAGEAPAGRFGGGGPGGR